MKAKRMLRALCLSVLSVQLWAQAPATADKSANAPAAQTASTDELKQLKERIAQQEEAIKKLQDSLNEQRVMLERAVKSQDEQQQAVQAAAAATPNPATPGDQSAKMVPVANVVKVGGPRLGQQPETAPPSPLSISIGDTTFTPLGFIDATFFWRSTNVGSGIGTNFAGVPYNNVAAGHLSETNFSAQNSRLGMRVDSKLMGWTVLGYLEADFLFNNNAASFQVGSNSAGFRLRNYFVDVSKGKFEFLGGQDWSMLTPNRKGLSPIPSDIFYTQNEDTNYQIGLVWSRDPQVRFIWHPSTHVAWGLSLENPQQFLGGGNGSGTVVVPTNLAGITGQFWTGASSATNVPNLAPDIISKIAFDATPGGKAMHFEIAGLMSSFRDYIPAGTAGAVVGTHSSIGGAGEINSNLEIVKNVKLIENLYFSNGGGRYIFGSAPDLALSSNGSISLVNSYSTVDGLEAQVAKKTVLSFYYGGMYIGKDVASQTTGAVTAGYGYPNSGGSQNRTVQELTFDWVQTLWKNKNYGALTMINQYSYVFRSPWSVASPAPTQAHTNLIYIDLRYTLP